jgi:uncharacterized protein YbaR (Trm112 family)
MKVIEKKCPNCGANLDFKVGERDVVCKSCRRKYAIEYGIDDLSLLSGEALDAIKAADISLRPVHKIIVIFVAVFIGLSVLATVFSIIQMTNARNKFNEKVEQSQQEFDRKTQQMIEDVQR